LRGLKKLYRRNWKKKYDHELILSRHQSPGPFPFVLVLDHLKAGYNVGKIIRAGNAFGCRELHLVGIPMFDPTPSKGSLKATKTRVFENIESSLELLTADGYEIFALAPDGRETLGQCSFPEKTAFVVGHEEFGLSFQLEKFPQVRTMKIMQFGSVQSLNVSIAAALASYEYLRQRIFLKAQEPLLSGLLGDLR